MALSNIVAELRGCVPGYSAMLARTHAQEAWTDIRNLKGWSFQLSNSAFATPGLVEEGAVSVTLGSDQVIGNAVATAAWLTAGTPISFLTNRQFRIGAGTIYNIIAFDDGQRGPSDPNPSPNFPLATLTLDRPYIDLETGNGFPFGSGGFGSGGFGGLAFTGYSIYQCYYPTPVKDFLAWESVLDTTNVIWLRCDGARQDRERIDQSDPQRQIFSNPGTLLPYQVDARPGSSTLGSMMYELYPQPQAQYVYSTWFSRSGADLIAPGDTLPYPITEDVVKAKARVKAYEWAEANKDPSNPRGAGADYRFLMGAAEASYAKNIKEIRLLDRDRVDMLYSRMSRLTGFGPYATFNPADGMVSARNL
jgi:hypothetical protein